MILPPKIMELGTGATKVKGYYTWFCNLKGCYFFGKSGFLDKSRNSEREKLGRKQKGRWLRGLHTSVND